MRLVASSDNNGFMRGKLVQGWIEQTYEGLDIIMTVFCKVCRKFRQKVFFRKLTVVPILYFFRSRLMIL